MSLFDAVCLIISLTTGNHLYAIVRPQNLSHAKAWERSYFQATALLIAVLTIH